ncbi:hypothetical protein BDY21DRAFT_348130 [Lineolata rhizophorae]|uniref:Secreted protein n=1 Tax=Lineolata rhizophorae TaxID=578093 RepID=A0A6A6NWK3_9PEZI|nr:hypothetical protein BDY21DRAFT_348130 [Lineolata rhizophorae]
MVTRRRIFRISAHVLQILPIGSAEEVHPRAATNSHSQRAHTWDKNLARALQGGTYPPANVAPDQPCRPDRLCATAGEHGHVPQKRQIPNGKI